MIKKRGQVWDIKDLVLAVVLLLILFFIYRWVFSSGSDVMSEPAYNARLNACALKNMGSPLLRLGQAPVDDFDKDDLPDSCDPCVRAAYRDSADNIVDSKLANFDNDHDNVPLGCDEDDADKNKIWLGDCKRQVREQQSKGISSLRCNFMINK